MENNNLNYSPQALIDLDEIWEYIYEELKNPTAAMSTVEGIMDAVDVLRQFPLSGAPVRFPGGLDSGYRHVLHGNYMAFYRLSGTDIYVDRVIYGKRDYMRNLFGDL